MYFYSIFLSSVLLMASMPAHAFPVVIGGIASNIFVLILSMFGTVQSSRKKNYGIALFFFCIFLFFSYQNAKDTELRTLALEHEYFPVEESFNSDYKAVLSDGNKALKNIRLGNADYIVVSKSKTQYIPGSHIIYFNDKDAIKDFSKDKNTPIYVFSDLRSHGIAIASYMESIGIKNVAIVDSAFLFDSVSGGNLFSEKQKLIDDMPDIPYNPITPNYHSIMNVLSKTNNFVITDNNQLKVHSFSDSFLLTLVDMAAMTEENWAKIKSELNPDLPTRISFSKSLGEDSIQAVLKYLAISLDLDPNEITYSMTFARRFGFTELSNDNQVTPIFFRSNVWLDAVDIYAMPSLIGKELTIACFTDECMERVPPAGSSYLSRNVSNYNPFVLDNWKIKIGEVPFDKKEAIVLSPEDSNSSLLSYYLAHELSLRGYDFRGFVKSNHELFGASYFRGRNSDLGEGVFLDSNKLRKFTEINKVSSFWMSLDSIEINNYQLVIIGLALGYLTFLGGFYSFVSAAICVWFFYSFSYIFKMPAQEYQYMIANPFSLTFLFGVYFLLQGAYSYLKPFGLKGLAVFSLGMYLTFFILNMTPTPFDRVYLGIISFLILGSFAVKLNKSLMYIPSKAGDKYTKTVPFLSSNSFTGRGFIIKPSTKNIPLLARIFGPRKWIIRSNHIVPNEQAYHGLFDSKSSLRKDLKSNIAKMKEDALLKLNPSSSGNDKLSVKEVQFWVMPYYSFKYKGVATSHAAESSFSISYSLDDEDMVTEGISSNYKFFHRKGRKSSHEKKIMNLIEQVESYYNKPVIIEFGINKFNNIKLLQVRFDDGVHSAFDQKILSLWRSGHRSAVNIESCSLSPLGRSVLSRLYGFSVVIDHENAYRINKSNSEFQYMDAVTSFNKMKAIHKNIDSYIDRTDLKTFVEIVADAVSPISNCITEFKSNRDHDDLMALVLQINNLMSITGGTIGSMDISEPWQSITIKATSSERDLCKSLMMYAVVLCKFYCEKSDLEIDRNLSIDSFSSGKATEGMAERQRSTDGWVIVPGAIPENYVDLEGLSRIPESEWKNYTLLVESFPVSDIALVSKLGGIVSRDGSPMSHLAMTAKHCGTPCKIGIKYFRPLEDMI